MPDGLTRLVRAILPKATPSEIADAAARLAALVESGASWVGDTAEQTVRKVDEVLSRESTGQPPPVPLSREQEDRLWAEVTRALAPREREIEHRAHALRDTPDASGPVVALTRDVDWLLGELHAAWGREVALRQQRAALERAAAERASESPP
ncbi:MAG TPA: hypothetical protein VFW66_04815 [Gemmatimonadales bacterium]|nr:hypothetical protein [Gemmatimonadales bacterium]